MLRLLYFYIKILRVKFLLCYSQMYFTYWKKYINLLYSLDFISYGNPDLRYHILSFIHLYPIFKGDWR